MSLNLIQIKNEIDSILNTFYKKVEEPNPSIVGIEEIYEEIIETNKKLAETLNVPESYWQTINDMKKREVLLFTVSNYRDHFIHSFNVFVVGYHIVNLLKPQELHTLLGINETEADEYNNIYRLWFLTSIFHDIGYTLQAMRKWLPRTLKSFLGIKEDELEKIYYGNFLDWGKFYIQNQDHIMAIKQNILNVYKKMKVTDADNNPFSFLKKTFEEGILKNQDHALLSGIWLLKQKSPEHSITKSQKEKEEEIRTIAAAAISLHNKKEIHQIKFRYSPMAFLLVFCDNLCEWGRVKFSEDGQLETTEENPKLRDIILSSNKIIGKLDYSINAENETKIRKKIHENVRVFADCFIGKKIKFEIKYYPSSTAIKEFSSVKFF